MSSIFPTGDGGDEKRITKNKPKRSSAGDKRTFKSTAAICVEV